MESSGMVSGLNLFTLLIVLVIVGIGYVIFLQSRRNREAAKRVHGIDDPPGQANVKAAKPGDPRL